MGETIEILLKENPTTGYIWQILDDELDRAGLKSVLRIKGSQYAQDENRRGAVGVGGTRRIELVVIGEGKGTLSLAHGRSWEIKAMLDKGEDISSVIQKKINIVAKAASEGKDL